MGKTVTEIDKEIEDLAENMAKSTTDSRQLLFDTIMELGPEGLKKAAADLTSDEQELLKSCVADLAKAQAVSQDLTPEKTTTDANKMKTESLSGSDDEDEKKLMDEKNANHPHQGGPKDKPEGWEGQIIKAIQDTEDLCKSLFKAPLKEASKVEIDEDKASVMNQICWKIDDLKRLKDSAWLIEDEVPDIKDIMEKKFSKIKSEIKDLASKYSSLKKSKEAEVEMPAKEAVNKLMEMEEAEHGKDIDGNGKVAEKLEKEKKMKKSLAEIVEMAKSLNMSKEEVIKTIKGSNEDLELVKGKMKEKMEEMKEESKEPKKEEAKEEKAEEKKEAKMEKSVQWSPKSSIAANTLGRNTHWDVDAYIEKYEQEKQETIKKGGYFGETQGESLKKSEGEAEKVDLNDLIAKGMDYSTDEIKRIEGVRDHKVEGKLVKSFDNIDIAKALGMTEEEYRKFFGE